MNFHDNMKIFSNYQSDLGKLLISFRSLNNIYDEYDWAKTALISNINDIIKSLSSVIKRRYKLDIDIKLEEENELDKYINIIMPIANKYLIMHCEYDIDESKLLVIFVNKISNDTSIKNKIEKIFDQRIKKASNKFLKRFNLNKLIFDNDDATSDIHVTDCWEALTISIDDIYKKLLSGLNAIDSIWDKIYNDYKEKYSFKNIITAIFDNSTFRVVIVNNNDRITSVCIEDIDAVPNIWKNLLQKYCASTTSIIDNIKSVMKDDYSDNCINIEYIGKILKKTEISKFNIRQAEQLVFRNQDYLNTYNDDYEAYESYLSFMNNPSSALLTNVLGIDSYDEYCIYNIWYVNEFNAVVNYGGLNGKYTKGIMKYVRPKYLNELISTNFNGICNRVCVTTIPYNTISWYMNKCISFFFRHRQNRKDVTLDDICHMITSDIYFREAGCCLNYMYSFNVHRNDMQLIKKDKTDRTYSASSVKYITVNLAVCHEDDDSITTDDFNIVNDHVSILSDAIRHWLVGHGTTRHYHIKYDQIVFDKILPSRSKQYNGYVHFRFTVKN